MLVRGRSPYRRRTSGIIKMGDRLRLPRMLSQVRRYAVKDNRHVWPRIGGKAPR